MIRSIRTRIAIPYVTLILVIMLGLGIYLSSFYRQIYLTNLKAQLLADVRVSGNALEEGLLAQSSNQELQDLIKQWSGLFAARLTLIAPDGTVLADSHERPEEMENHRDRPEIQQALQGKTGSSTRFSRTLGYQTIYTAIPVYQQDQLAAVLRISLPLERVETTITQLQRAILSASFFASLFAVLIAILIANRTTRPVRELTAAVTHLAEQDLKKSPAPELIVPRTADETGQLTQAFNLLMQELHRQIINLEAERSKLNAVLQKMTDGVLMVDPQGRIEMLNPAVEAMFGITAEAVLGSTLAEGIRHHQVVELWKDCRDSQETQRALLEISSHRLYLHGVATPLDQAIPPNVLLLLQNITRQRYLETVRRDFISNLSHELRTPLASLKALTETLQEGALDDPPATQRFLVRMDKEVDALTQMVTELLELSRIESDKVPFQLEPTQPCAVIFPAVDRLRMQAERAGLSLSIECPPDLPAIYADQNRLELVLVNLLHNAIKFTDPGGEIKIQASFHEAMQGEVPGQVLFAVSDTGIGIPSEDLPRIFERFYKADRARASGGTGLGLAIARHTVEAHGGKIWAISQEGRGSTFYFTIPTTLTPLV